MKNKNSGLFTKKVIVGAIAVSALLLFYLVLLLNGISFSRDIQKTPKANITVIAVGGIPTPDLNMLSVTSTATISPSEIINGVSIGAFVKIEGTEGAGLRIRSSPSINAEMNFLANESEVFVVIGGPSTIDNITWWQLATPYDENRQGWASAEYLMFINEE